MWEGYHVLLIAQLVTTRLLLDGVRRCCRRPQNNQICLPQNSDFYKAVPKAADFLFAGAVDLWKMYVEVRRLTLFSRNKKKEKKVFLTSFQT